MEAAKNKDKNIENSDSDPDNKNFVRRVGMTQGLADDGNNEVWWMR